MSGWQGSLSAALARAPQGQTHSFSTAGLTSCPLGAAPLWPLGASAGAGTREKGQRSSEVCRKGEGTAQAELPGSKLGPWSQVARVTVPAPSPRS